ncbi:MAG TPA: hypothetical protein VFB90_02785 [Dehalococcoidia bacterium]|nr:hypothetical protein [Dehalococcoidia bacterium]
MTTETLDRPQQLEQSREIIAEMQAEVLRGEEHWFIVLLQTIGRWTLPSEEVGDRRFQYLIAGEAFDWLLLAERLSLELADLTPADEMWELLFRSRLPLTMDEETFRRLIGPAKYRAHLNFVYGVQVEEALQLVLEQELQKEHRSSIWRNGQQDDDIYQRLYGSPRQELLSCFANDNSLIIGDTISLGDLKAFTYWLFKRRINYCEPARVASDTRKGMTALQQIQAAARRNQP